MVSGPAGSVYRITASSATTLNGNIASSAMTLTGSPSITSDPDGVHGESKDSTALANQSTYMNLGWDFTSVWKMEGSPLRPVLK
jgi:hypothetical protein